MRAAARKLGGVRSRGALFLGCGVLGWVACSASLAPSPASRGSAPSASAAPAPRRALVAAAAPSRSVTQVAVREPEQLRALEGHGFGFSQLSVEQSATSTAELSRLPALRGLFATLQSDVKAAARPYPLARVTSSDGFRLFDARWLASNEMRFVLSGVFNRLDRRPFYAASCGEVRFVYRLAYSTTQGGAPLASRLPLTLNVVFWVDAESDETCQAAAANWQSPPELSSVQLVEWLVKSGPLSRAARARWRMKSIESNLQTFRLQSSVHPSLGGHIEYDLRVFHPKDEARSDFAPAAMENMPDVPALQRDRPLSQALLAELRRPETLRALDRGTLLLPERFLARQAKSFAPRGLGRRANRPFSQLFGEQDFRELDLSGYDTIRSPAALLRRLDGASCSGCHQSRSIAGFHHVGQDDVEEPTFNALRSGSSPHLSADLERRRLYIEDVAAGRSPDERRPFPERQGVGAGQGAPCGLGDPGFADWKCSEGFSCSKLEDAVVGTCLASQAIGAPCEYGSMLSGNAPQRDRIGELTKHACAPAERCTTNFSGFPQGACTASCQSGEPDSACADYLDVDGFQNCLRGRDSYAACAKQFVFEVGVQACDERRACRQDYVCARTRRGDSGACLPPYFVYQLRLDGYPLKR
jgi:hypothetical protein